MIRTNLPALQPAGEAWSALLAVAAAAEGAGAATLPEAAAAWNLARTAVPERRLPTRRPRPRVGAGRIVEVLPGPRRGAPLLVPAGGALPGIDEAREDVSLFRVQIAGHVEGRCLEEGALVLVARRAPERGALVAIADRRAVRLAVAGADSLRGPSDEARILGVVEAVIGQGRRAA